MTELLALALRSDVTKVEAMRNTSTGIESRGCDARGRAKARGMTSHGDGE